LTVQKVKLPAVFILYITSRCLIETFKLNLLNLLDKIVASPATKIVIKKTWIKYLVVISWFAVIYKASNAYILYLDCTGFAGHVEKTYNEVKGRVRNYEREQISQKV